MSKSASELLNKKTVKAVPVESLSSMDEVNLERSKEKLLQEKEFTARLKFDYWARLVTSFIVPLLVVGWILAVGWFVHSATLFECATYHVDDNVLIALVGGTSASILTLLILIIKYLFPSNKR